MRSYDAIIFDFGRVLTAFAPDDILRTLLGDPGRALRVRRAIFTGPTWNAMDQGLLSEADALARIVDANPEEAEGVRRFFAHYKDFLAILPAGADLVERVRRSGHFIYALSNMSREAWASISQRRAFLDLFDGVVISAQERLLKPDPAIFERLLSRYDLDPGRCILVDDVPANVEAARCIGFDGLHFENHRQAAAALERRGVFTGDPRAARYAGSVPGLRRGTHPAISRP